MCPSVLVDEELPKVVVDDFVDASYARSGNDKLTLVAEKELIARGMVDP